MNSETRTPQHDILSPATGRVLAFRANTLTSRDRSFAKSPISTRRGRVAVHACAMLHCRGQPGLVRGAVRGLQFRLFLSLLVLATSPRGALADTPGNDTDSKGSEAKDSSSDGEGLSNDEKALTKKVPLLEPVSGKNATIPVAIPVPMALNTTLNMTVVSANASKGAVILRKENVDKRVSVPFQRLRKWKRARDELNLGHEMVHRLSKDCHYSRFGCCQDDFTPAIGPGMKGCDILDTTPTGCSTTLFGCCDDMITIAKGPMHKGCPEAIWKEIDDLQLQNQAGVLDKMKLIDQTKVPEAETNRGENGYIPPVPMDHGLEVTDLEAFAAQPDEPRTPNWYAPF